MRVGCEVLIRNVRPEGEREIELPEGLHGDHEERVIAIVASADEMGLYRLTTRTPLGRALLGHRVGDVVSVPTQACTVAFEVLAIDAPVDTITMDAGLAEQVDAAVLKTAPVKGPGSSPGAGTSLGPGLTDGVAAADHYGKRDVRDGRPDMSLRGEARRGAGMAGTSLAASGERPEC